MGSNTRGSGAFALKSIILVNVISFCIQEGLLEVPWDTRNNPLFSINHSTIGSILWSMFHHVDGGHLCSNMLGLYVYGWDTFVTTSSRKWNSILAVLWIYIGSGIGAAFGLRLQTQHFQRQWNFLIKTNRRQFHDKCHESWICNQLNFKSITTPIVDLYTHIRNAEEFTALDLYKTTKRVGASGAVYGVMGARIYTSLFSPSTHYPLCRNDLIYVGLNVAYELRNSPIQLNQLWDKFVMGTVSGDTIDHASHMFGFMSGITLAFLWQQSSHFWWNRHRWNRGGGRRLGGGGGGGGSSSNGRGNSSTSRRNNTR